MKTLNSYVSEATTQLFDKHNAFFAFSNKQFDEQCIEGVEYVSTDLGLICPKENVKQLMEELEAIHTKGVAQDIEENGVINIIKRELANYETYYTGDISDCVDALKSYNISREQILEVYKIEAPKHYDD